MYTSYLNTRVFVDKSSIYRPSIIDFPIIDDSNCILYHYRDDYVKFHNLNRLDSGVIIHNNKYYLFAHNFTHTPRNINECFSYNVYQITEDTFKDILHTKSYFIWDIRFQNWFHFQKQWVVFGSKIYVRSLESVSYFNNGDLIIPFGQSPSGMIIGTTIREFFEEHKKKYGSNYPHYFELNKTNYRNLILNEILNESF